MGKRLPGPGISGQVLGHGLHQALLSALVALTPKASRDSTGQQQEAEGEHQFLLETVDPAWGGGRQGGAGATAHPPL